MLDKNALYQEILTAVGQQELERVKVLIGSRTLRQAIYLAVDASAGVGRLVVPHYWAVYYHDGRGSVSPVSARKLVFFEDALRNDPRLQGRYPERASDIRRLTRQEYQEGLERNAERRAAGLPPFMFVVDSVGPSRPRPFFDQLTNGAAARAGTTIARIFDRHVQAALDQDPDLRAEKGVAEFDL